MALAHELERNRAALTMIHGDPYNAEAPSEGLDTEITPTELHYVRSNFAVPAHDGTPRVWYSVLTPPPPAYSKTSFGSLLLSFQAISGM